MREIGSLLIAAWFRIGSESRSIDRQNIIDEGIDCGMNLSDGNQNGDTNNQHDQIKKYVDQIVARYIDEMLRVEAHKVESELNMGNDAGSDSEDMDGEDGYKMSEVYNTVGSISGVVSTN